MLRELSPADLAWRCDDGWLPWGSSDEVEPAAGIVGQDRAVEAIAFGLDMRGVGYNVFVAGLAGTGRLTTITRFLDQLASGHEPPDDLCYVESFRSPEVPRLLLLKPGAGRRLKEFLDLMVGELEEHLPSILADPELRRRVERASGTLRRRERKLIEGFEDEARKLGFEVVQIQVGAVTHPELMPVVGDRPVGMEELASLVEEGVLDDQKVSRIEESHARLADRLEGVMLSLVEVRVEIQRRVEAARREAIRPLLDAVVERVRRTVDDPRAGSFLADLRDDLERHLGLFSGGGGESAADSDRFQRWRANLVVDNSTREGLPVVLETEPTLVNLFGTIERAVTTSGEPASSFMHIRAGSLLKANGGFAVLNVDDLLADSEVWTALKRALKYRRVQIRPAEAQILGAAALRPEPVPLDVKVVVIGDRTTYDWLYRLDPEFQEIFKSLAEFDSVMANSRDNAVRILSVLRKVSAEEGLLPLDRGGMAAMLEHAVGLSRYRRRFTSRFSDLADLFRQASRLAERSGAALVGRDHVTGASSARRRRHGLSEQRVHELIAEGLIHVATTGSAIGQVNGLTVYDFGHHRFGRPARITARVGIGRDGVINVERQSGLSGPSHDKGVQILSGFLRGTFAQRSPLTMSCSITFEQSYGGVDGDSASSTEVYAILSALAELPLRQDLAVTGSVDQYGRLQAIGGVNQKVGGFFRVCQAQGLTGAQGVMIPGSNVDDLHLEPDVVEAVARGEFRVVAVDSVEEGIELLTGLPAGRWTPGDGWPAESVYGRCQRRLEEMNRLMRQAGKDGAEAGDNGAAACER